MKFEPDYKMWMDYLYGEMPDDDKARMEAFLQQSEDARKQLAQYRQLRSFLQQHGEDREIIVPPLESFGVRQQPVRTAYLNSPFVKKVAAVAAAIVLVLVAGKFTDARVSFSSQEWKITFGAPALPQEEKPVPALTSAQVQQMIDNSVANSQELLDQQWEERQKKLVASIAQNAEADPARIDALVKKAANASQEEIRAYALQLETKNLEMVKEYFDLSQAEQKKYIEELLVDFAKYLEQQQRDDMHVVQMRLRNLEQNTTVFRKETEQILANLISTVRPPVSEVRY